MIQLTSIFEEALAGRDWNQDTAGGALDALGGVLEGSTVDWDRGDEEWGRVLVGDAVRALVCAKVAVAVILGPDWPRDAIEHLRRSGVSIIKTDTLDDAQYAVDKALLEEIFGRPMSENINFDRCSLNDLWWATV